MVLAGFLREDAGEIAAAYSALGGPMPVSTASGPRS